MIMQDKVSLVLNIFWYASIAFFIYMIFSTVYAAGVEIERIAGLKEVCEAQGGQFLAGQYGTHVCFPEKMFK
jgi:hypothetical protein